MHDVDTLRSQLTDPETVISLGDRDLDLGRTHAASDLMRQIKCFDCTEVREGSDAHPDRGEAPRSFSENGMPKESIALRGGRCDSPMIVTRMPISRHTLSASAFM
jgi:hypothetical protein